MKKKQRAIIPAMVAIIAGAMTVFISKSNDEPSDCALWKVQIENSTFYLAGSIHVAKEENYPLDKAYTKAYNKADKVIFELENGFENIDERILKYAEEDKLPGDTTLSQFLSPESVERIKEVLDEDMFPILDKYEAWLMNMTLSVNKLKLVGYDPKLAVDRHFYDKALKDGKEIMGLDPIERQLVLFDFEVPFTKQISFLENAVSKLEKYIPTDEKLCNTYYANDMEAFEKAFVDIYDLSNPQMQGAYNMIFTNRNILWVDKIEEIAKEEAGKYFVLVGTGHYFGQKNIRELLEEKGYAVEKI